MTYTKTTWVNDGAPAINAANLNKIEQGIEDAHNLSIQTGVVNVTSTSYILQSSDAGQAVLGDNASAQSFEVPAGVFSIGDRILICQIGQGNILITQGAGATVNSRGAAMNLTGQYAMASLICYAADIFLLSGDIS